MTIAMQIQPFEIFVLMVKLNFYDMFLITLFVICSGGFFSLKYEISDVSSLVQQLNSYQDPVMIEILTTEVRYAV